MLDNSESKRYSRQIILPEIGLSGQKKLKDAEVLMVGAGGLGCPVLQYLVAAGVGTIGIIDNDKVDLSNLHRQILYSEADIGKPKAATAKEKLELLNSNVDLTAYNERLLSENAIQIFKDYDLIIDGSDNFATRYLVNDTCVDQNKVLVFGSIFKFEGHVSVFNYKGGPQYRDVFPDTPADGQVPNCAEIGVLGVLPGIIGMYMANEAIKVICDIGETLSGKLMTINALNNKTSIFKIARSSNETGIPVTAIKADPPKTENEVTLDEFDLWMGDFPESVLLIDVREEYEFEEYNIGGVNIPLYELKDKLKSLPEDKKLVFCCKTGQRSRLAIQLIKNLYKGEMYSIKNGIQ